MLTSQEGRKEERGLLPNKCRRGKRQTYFLYECTCHGVSVSALRVDKENRKDTVLSGYKALLD